MPPQGTAARAAAFDILRATGAGQRFEAARDRAMVTLDERDRRLAQEIAAGVLRSRRELDRRLRGLLAHRWARTDQELRDLLRIGTYQLTHLDRVPAYAAVQSTVELAKDRVGKKSAALVNAVLRRVAQHADAAPAGQDGLAARHSHPDWLVSRWVAHFGRDTTEALLRHNNRRPPLVLQPVRGSLAELRATLARAGVEAHESGAGDGLVVEARRPQDLPGYADGAFVVQGPAQARFLREAGIPAGALVWDSCAAPGGKAVTLSRDHRVLASDIDRRRVGRLMDSLQRTRAAVTVLAADARHPPLAPGSMDAVWLDVPCTATGTFARHPDARWRVSRRRLLALAQLQRDLLERVAPVVGSGGHLVYTTCSLEPEENGERVEAFLSNHGEFQRAQPDLLVFPPDTGSDGGYLAVLKKT